MRKDASMSGWMMRATREGLNTVEDSEDENDSDPNGEEQPKYQREWERKTVRDCRGGNTG